MVRSATLFCGVGLLFVGICGSAFAEEEATSTLPEGKDALQSLTWLEGTWRGVIDDQGMEYETRYGTPEGGALLSTSKQLSEGWVLGWELECWTADGTDLIMQPYYMGDKLTPFTAVVCEPNHVVVTDPANEWPQIIEYRREKDVLVIALGTLDESGALIEDEAQIYTLYRQ